MASLLKLAKKRVLEEVLGVVPNDLKILVTDSYSVKIFGSIMKMFEIVAENVILIENISLSRKRFDFDAIYFLSPCSQSVSQLIRDFEEPGNYQYPRAHLFFISPLSESLLQKIASSPAFPFIKTCKEFYLDLIVFESQVFHFNSENYLPLLSCPSELALSPYFQDLAIKITSVCTSLGELPNIRFYNGTSRLPERLSKYLLSYWQENIKKGLVKLNYCSGHRGTLLLLERGFDLVSPLLHEFTYQAMANDLLDIENGKNYSYKSGSGSEASAPGSICHVVLDENDELWRTYRHKHIAQVITEFLCTFNKFISENKIARKTSFGKTLSVFSNNVSSFPEQSESVSSNNTVKSLSEMRKLLSSLPQFQELKSQYSLHMNLIQSCMRAFNEQKLAALASQEQNLATGLDAHGKPIKDFVADFAELLIDDSISPTNKTRLLMTYFISRKYMDEDEQKKLLELSHLDTPQNKQLFTKNLPTLGIPLANDSFTSGKSFLEPKGSGGFFKKLKQKLGASSTQQESNSDVNYELSRYSPPLKKLIEEFFTNKLDEKRFPRLPCDTSIISNFLKQSSYKNNSHLSPIMNNFIYNETSPQLALSLRRNNHPPPLTDKSKQQQQQQQSKDSLEQHPKLIVFILGGLTYSEMRVCSELQKSLHRNIVLGGTCVLTPNSYVKQISEL